MGSFPEVLDASSSPTWYFPKCAVVYPAVFMVSAIVMAEAGISSIFPLEAKPISGPIKVELELVFPLFKLVTLNTLLSGLAAYWPLKIAALVGAQLAPFTYA